jgi:hypothetical protein
MLARRGSARRGPEAKVSSAIADRDRVAGVPGARASGKPLGGDGGAAVVTALMSRTSAPRRSAFLIITIRKSKTD